MNEATAVTRARADVLADALDGCPDQDCPACRSKHQLVDRLIEAVRAEERQHCELRLAGIDERHLRSS